MVFAEASRISLSCEGKSASTELQSSYRNVVDRNDADVIYGFRCVLAAEEKPDDR